MAVVEEVKNVELLSEMHLGSSTKALASSVSGLGLSACASSTYAAVKMSSSVLLTNLGDFHQHSSLPTPTTTGIGGVALSPCCTYVAVFSSDALYVAQVHSIEHVGQLRHVAQLAGIKTVHWCPGSTALAVICKQQVDVHLLVLPPCPASELQPHTTQHPGQQQQPALALTPLQRLPGPQSATAGARCATWLPRSSADAPAGLLAAWPTDLLMYTWRPAAQGVVDWQCHKVHRFLAGWPGPVRAVAAAACFGSSSSSDSSLVLGTVDSQLLDQLSSGHAGAVSGTQSPTAAGPASPQLLAPRQAGQPLIRDLQDDAPAAQSGTPDTAAAVTGYPEVMFTTSQRLLQSGQQGVGVAAGPSSNGSSGVLSSLLNIGAAKHSNGTRQQPNGTGSLSRSGSSQLSSACLCLLQISLSDFLHSSSSSSSNGDGGAQASKELPQGPFTSMLLLPHLPLPDLLAVHQNIAAVGSSKGAPLVTLCSFGSQQGLQLLQTVMLPLPSPVQPGISKARLEGLVLTSSAQQQQQNQDQMLRSASNSSFSSLYPIIAEGGWAGVVDEQPSGASAGKSSATSSRHGQGLPDVVALVVCSQAQQQGGFASFGSTALDRAADTYVVKCRVKQEAKQTAALQRSRSLPPRSPPRPKKQQQQQEQQRQVQEQQQQQRQVQQQQCQVQKQQPEARQLPAGHLSVTDPTVSAADAEIMQKCPWWRNLQLEKQKEQERQQREQTRQEQMKKLQLQQEQKQPSEAHLLEASSSSTISAISASTSRASSEQQQQQVKAGDSMQLQSAAARVDNCVAALSGAPPLHAGMQARLEGTGAADAASGTGAAGGVLNAHQQFMVGLQQQALLEQVREESAAATQSAFAALQASLEQRLDAMHQQQQQLGMVRMQSESALAAVLTGLQASLEQRLDAMHGTMQAMVRQLDRLATGLEDMEGGG